MWSFNFKKNKQSSSGRREPVVYSVISKLKLVNNRTDKVYEFVSSNEFGLEVHHHKDTMQIEQLFGIGDNKKHNIVAQFKDFSIIEVKHDTIIK